MTEADRSSEGPCGPSGLPVGDLLRSEPITIDLPVPAVVLAIGAHPDDIEFGCGATLAKWAVAGARVHHLVLTDGSKGSWDPDADLAELVAARQSECQWAASIVDGHPGRPSSADRVLFLHRVDGELENGVDERRAVARIIRSLRPTVLVGHDPWRRYRLHPDHRAAGYLTLDALVAARDHHFFTELALEPHRPEALLLFEADLPNHLEDARGYEETKIDALLCHHSQLQSTMGITPDDHDGGTGPSKRSVFASQVRHQLADHGSLADRPAAEAFRLITDL